MSHTLHRIMIGLNVDVRVYHVSGPESKSVATSIMSKKGGSGHEQQAAYPF